MSILTTIHCLLRIAALGFEKLPIAPHAIDHSVVDVEGWVAWGGEEVAAGVAAGGGVRSGLGWAQPSGGEVRVGLPDDIVSAAVRAYLGRVGHSFEEVAVGGNNGF